MIRSLTAFLALALIAATTAVSWAEPLVMLEADNFPGSFIRHRDFKAVLSQVPSSRDKADATFIMTPALNGQPGAVSFESKNVPGNFLRHVDFRLELWANDESSKFADDASFKQWNGLSNGGAKSFEAVNFGQYFIRHKDNLIWVGANENSPDFASDATFHVKVVGESTPPKMDPTPDPTPPADGEGGGATTASTDTTIYDKPGGADLAYLAAGDAVTVVDCNGDNWCRISKPQKGWVWGDDLSR